jgi:hypothetical protein
MTVENHWRQLKHQYLMFTHRPRLDHTIHTICTAMVPAYVASAARLEDSYRLGHPKSLTPYKVAFKKNWKLKSKAMVSGKAYGTDVSRWLCNCGGQETDAHHLCKHLVQAVPKPPARFFSEIVRRRKVPLYQHPCLHVEASGQSEFKSAEDGSVTDGDDHEGIGGVALLMKARCDKSGVGGWANVLSGAAKGLLKRKRPDEDCGDSAESQHLFQRRRTESQDPSGSGAEEEAEWIEVRHQILSLRHVGWTDIPTSIPRSKA